MAAAGNLAIPIMDRNMTKALDKSSSKQDRQPFFQ
jgi:hypothetical protein